MKVRIGLFALVGLLLAVLMMPLFGQRVPEERVDQTIREYGSVESSKSVSVVNQLTGEATILTVVPDGQEVKKGDLLVSLDDSKLQQARNEARIELHSAQAAVESAKRKIDSTRIAARGFEEYHQLNLKVAELNYKKHTGEEGAFAVSLRDVERNAELAETRKKLVATMMARQKAAKEGPGLAQLEFESKKAEADLSKAREQIQLLTTQEHPYQKAVLELAIAKAKGELLKQKQDSEAAITKAELDLQAAKLVEDRAKARLARVEDQLVKCRLTAPADGVVVYANAAAARRSAAAAQIEEGATIRERQPILQIVDVSQLRLRVAVHESRIRRVEKGQTARIRFDGIPGKTFTGKVLSVSNTPDPANWFSSDVKTYAVLVSIDDPVKKVKLGLSAMVEIDAP